MMVKISLHRRAVDVIYVQVHDSQASPPFLVAFRKIVVLRVENAIDECKVVFYLLVAFNVETAFGLSDSCL